MELYILSIKILDLPFLKDLGDLLAYRRPDRLLYLSRFFAFPLSSFPVLLSFGNTSFSHTSRNPIWTKLGRSDQYLDHYSRTKDGGVSSHDGVTGSKRLFSPKRHQKDIKSYRMRSIDKWFMYMHKLDPLYKCYHIKKIIRGHLGSQSSKVYFS